MFEMIMIGCWFFVCIASGVHDFKKEQAVARAKTAAVEKVQTPAPTDSQR